MGRDIVYNFSKERIKEALKRHDSRIGVANSLGCSPSYVTKLLNEVHKELKGLARWDKAKSDKNRIWGRY